MLQTNLEATKVVVEQLRLRNIGGLIIIDFIDMERAANRNKVTEALREALKKDKTRTSLRKISELPVVDGAGRPVGMLDITDLIGLEPLEPAQTRPVLRLTDRLSA